MPRFSFLPQGYQQPSLPQPTTEAGKTYFSDFNRAYDLFAASQTGGSYGGGGGYGALGSIGQPYDPIGGGPSKGGRIEYGGGGGMPVPPSKGGLIGQPYDPIGGGPGKGGFGGGGFNAPANYNAFLQNQMRSLLNRRYQSLVAQQAAQGIPTLQPLDFLGGIDPYAEFLNFSPAQRGEINMLPLLRRVR